MNNEKWQKYLRIQEEDYSGSCEVDEGARSLHKDLINLLPGGFQVLDIGCGTGWSTKELSKKYTSAIGISIQPEEIKFAEEHNKNIHIEHFVMDMHELFKTWTNCFDAVYMREALEHSIAPFIALCEVNRVLKVGGSFMVNVPSQDWVDWHCHYFVPTEKQLKSLLDKTNFEIVRSGITAGGHLYNLCKKIKDIEWIK